MINALNALCKHVSEPFKLKCIDFNHTVCLFCSIVSIVLICHLNRSTNSMYAVSILQCQISTHKREQVVIDCSVLCALLNFMKTTFSIAVYLVGICYHLQWLMLAPLRVSNAFNLTLICQLLHILLILIIFNGPA